MEFSHTLWFNDKMANLMITLVSSPRCHTKPLNPKMDGWVGGREAIRCSEVAQLIGLSILY